MHGWFGEYTAVPYMYGLHDQFMPTSPWDPRHAMDRCLGPLSSLRETTALGGRVWKGKVM